MTTAAEKIIHRGFEIKYTIDLQGNYMYYQIFYPNGRSYKPGRFNLTQKAAHVYLNELKRQIDNFLDV